MGECGSTLVDLMASAVMLVVALGGIVNVVVNNASLRRVDDELVLAHHGCRTKVEQLRSLDFAVLPAQNGSGFAVGDDDPAVGKLTPVSGDSDGLVGEVEVTLEESVGNEKLYRITVVADWTGVRGQRRFSMTTLLADRRRRK